jgi:hypothetical protein
LKDINAAIAVELWRVFAATGKELKAAQPQQPQPPKIWCSAATGKELKGTPLLYAMCISSSATTGKELKVRNKIYCTTDYKLRLSILSQQQLGKN